MTKSLKNELSENKEYKQLYSENIEAFIKKVKDSGKNNYSNKKYGLFFPIIGKEYIQFNDLLVIGRATNGWESDFKISCNNLDVDKLVNNSIKSSTEEDNNICPLEWLWKESEDSSGNKHGYNFRKSPFWNVIYKIVKKKNSISDNNNNNWTHYIAWSNLMKIAPAEGGNPNNFERNSQFDGCSKLLWKEIDILNPKFVLLITGRSWEKYFNADIFKEVNNNYVQCIANYKNSKIIVTIRPESKPQDEFVENVLKYLK